MNDDRYMFPAPGKAFYLLTLAGECKDCDAPPGITIELIEPDNVLYREYRRGDFDTEKLKFAKWADSKGAGIVTGMRQHEFVKSVSRHLVGIRPADFDMKATDKIDANMAEVILEEMYEDSQVKPWLVEDKSPAADGTEGKK